MLYERGEKMSQMHVGICFTVNSLCFVSGNLWSRCSSSLELLCFSDRSCLNLISISHLAITEEHDLIESLRLLSGFGVSILPVQGGPTVLFSFFHVIMRFCYYTWPAATERIYLLNWPQSFFHRFAEDCGLASVSCWEVVPWSYC